MYLSWYRSSTRRKFPGSPNYVHGLDSQKPANQTAPSFIVQRNTFPRRVPPREILVEQRATKLSRDLFIILPLSFLVTKRRLRSRLLLLRSPPFSAPPTSPFPLERGSALNGNLDDPALFQERLSELYSICKPNEKYRGQGVGCPFRGRKVNAVASPGMLPPQAFSTSIGGRRRYDTRPSDFEEPNVPEAGVPLLRRILVSRHECHQGPGTFQRSWAEVAGQILPARRRHHGREKDARDEEAVDPSIRRSLISIVRRVFSFGSIVSWGISI